MVKRYFRYIFFGLSLFCIARILEQNSIKLSLQDLQPSSYILLFLALVITLCAHTWSAYVWYIILRSFRIKNLDLSGILSLYLVSNIYKYVPGNIGHFYLRITYLTKAGYPLDLAGVSVLLEPILMALAALWLGLVCIVSSLLAKIGLGILGIISISFLIQPRILNHFFKSKEHEVPYLLIPLIGEIIFILIRGGGFLLTATALGLAHYKTVELMGAFSLAWLCGLIVPGLPGGLGIFEATLLTLLNHHTDQIIILIQIVAFFRIISIVAEIIGAGIGKMLAVRFSN
jgi:hypothetical protein